MGGETGQRGLTASFRRLAPLRAFERLIPRRRRLLHVGRNSTKIMSQLFRLLGSVKRDPAIERWIQQHTDELGQIARHWFELMRQCGDDVRESLHDGCPTACVADAAFAYVGAFKAHVNVGFFRGAEIADPKGLLEGTGKFMRHVKLRPGHTFDAEALSQLIGTAYTDMKNRVHAARSLSL